MYKYCDFRSTYKHQFLYEHFKCPCTEPFLSLVFFYVLAVSPSYIVYPDTMSIHIHLRSIASPCSVSVVLVGFVYNIFCVFLAADSKFCVDNEWSVNSLLWCISLGIIVLCSISPGPIISRPNVTFLKYAV